jgi:lysozyme
MSEQDRLRLRSQLTRHEGLRLKPYLDSVGVLTIGVGRNLRDVGISEDEATYLLDNDLDRATIGVLNAFPWVLDLSDVRKAVLVNMCFNLGIGGLAGFVRTLESIEDGNYGLAAEQMLESKWARQVGARAIELSEQMRLGEWQT